jgi:hypothetical protein
MKRLKILFSNQRTATIFWMLVDIFLINVAFALAYWVRYDLQLFRAVDPAFAVTYNVYLPFVALFTLLLSWSIVSWHLPAAPQHLWLTNFIRLSTPQPPERLF